jgi:RNA polymerase sigma-70 factor, ECF subfamily
MNQAEPTDEALAVAVQQGDADAFGVLVNRFEAKLKRYARKFLSYEEDIEDVVQDVFIKAYINIQSFDTSRRFSPWLYRVAHNTFVNELKRKGRQGGVVFDFDTILPHLPATETADSLSLGKELKAQFDSLIGELSPKYREIIVLFYEEKLSYEEISDILKIPVTTVGVRLKRGREKLQASYEKLSQTYE